MTATIYTASELKERRTEVLEAATRGRALVRGVDGTALVFTRLEIVERAETVAKWAVLLHRVEQGGDLPSEVRWLRHFDDEDRAEFVAEMWEAMEDVRAEGELGAFREALAAWKTTARAIADDARRSVLLAEIDGNDFVQVERPA
ncbi:MAG: hypothetical protein ACR2KP_04935 [Egibacteraceae bacterium]